MALAVWRRSKFGSKDGVKSSLVSVKEKQATINCFRVLKEGLEKFLKLI